jgi:hypothetical protein
MSQTKQHPTAVQLKEVVARLQYVGEYAFFKVDGYLISAQVVQVNRAVKIAVYVNGWIKGKWVWRGKESELDTMPEIPRKFYCLTKKGHSKKQIAVWERLYGKREAKNKGVYEKHCFAKYQFSTANAFITHLKKHNQHIEILTYEQYAAQKQGLAEEDDDETAS